MSNQKKILVIGIDHAAVLRQLEQRVRQCCRHCKNMGQNLEQAEGYGIYTNYHCEEYERTVATFPIFGITHKQLLVSPDEINVCRHYEQKELSKAPLFETATSA
jgi:hypothetical protein